VSSDELVNKGIIFKSGVTTSQPGTGRTFIVSGIGRGGTTLLAALLREGGLYLGTHLAESVLEDLDMMHVLRFERDLRLNQVIAQRNAAFENWGFKVPNMAPLHAGFIR
jgi:hypothetical protein